MKVEGGGHYLRAVNDGARTVYVLCEVLPGLIVCCLNLIVKLIAESGASSA